MTRWDESKGYMPGTNQRIDAGLANEGMTQPSPPTCSWRPGDAEALRIALSIPVSAPSHSALDREMALLQTPYPTGVCTAQGHLDAIAGLDQQLAVVDYATELLLEETDTEWNPAGPSPAHRQPVGSAPCCAPVASTAALRQRPPLPV